LWQERLLATRFSFCFWEHRCCSCKPPCFGEDQWQAVIHFCQIFAACFCRGCPSIRHQPSAVWTKTQNLVLEQPRK
jgi:hypothetical protein